MHDAVPVVSIACIVEGDGEVSAVPILIRRVAARLETPVVVRCPRPFLVPRNKLVKPGQIEDAVTAARRGIDGEGGILIIADSDEDCPAILGPALLHRAARVRGNMPVAVVLAKREFEAWFLAAADSLRGRRGLSTDLRPPNDPEAVADAKGWLRERMPRGRRYRETADQPALATSFDLDAARSRADSFDKCYREVVRLLTSLTEEAGLSP